MATRRRETVCRTNGKDTEMNKPRQMTKDEAIAFFNGDEWKDMSDYGIVALQICQDKLCVPFSRFHEAIEKVLNAGWWLQGGVSVGAARIFHGDKHDTVVRTYAQAMWLLKANKAAEKSETGTALEAEVVAGTYEGM